MLTATARGRGENETTRGGRLASPRFIFPFASRVFKTTMDAPLPLARPPRVDPLRDGSIFDRRYTADGGGEASGAR